MDDFNDFYNRFIASYYGVNVLNSLFFIAAFFAIILFGIFCILLQYRDYGNTEGKFIKYQSKDHNID